MPIHATSPVQPKREAFRGKKESRWDAAPSSNSSSLVQGVAWDWSELIKKLHADSRYVASVAGEGQDHRGPTGTSSVTSDRHSEFRVEEAWVGIGRADNPAQRERLANKARQLVQHNEAILSGLPSTDLWPPLDRHMFAWIPSHVHVPGHYGGVIHFAATLKEVHWDLQEWLDKFVQNIRGLVDRDVRCHIHAEELSKAWPTVFSFP